MARVGHVAQCNHTAALEPLQERTPHMMAFMYFTLGLAAFGTHFLGDFLCGKLVHAAAAAARHRSVR